MNAVVLHQVLVQANLTCEAEWQQHVSPPGLWSRQTCRTAPACSRGVSAACSKTQGLQQHGSRRPACPAHTFLEAVMLLSKLASSLRSVARLPCAASVSAVA